MTFHEQVIPMLEELEGIAKGILDDGFESRVAYKLLIITAQLHVAVARETLRRLDRIEREVYGTCNDAEIAAISQRPKQ